MREVLDLALPLVASTLSIALMQYCDRLFLTWHSSLAVAAVIQAGALSWSLYCLPMGLVMFTTTFVAQYHGAAAPERIGRIVWQAIWLGVASIPLFLVVGWQLPVLFTWLGHSSELQAASTIYFRIALLGLGPSLLAEALTAYFVGIGRTGVVMKINAGAALLNVALDYLMIFGVGPIPPMGLAGAAWATTIAIWFKLAWFAVEFVLSPDRLRHRLWNSSGWRLDSTLRLFRFGTPQGVQFLIEGLAVTFFIMLLGGVSEQASAATAIALSANMVVFVPLWGLGIAVTTLVGREIGRQRVALAQRAVRVALAVGLIYAGLFAALYFFAPVIFLGVFDLVEGSVRPEIHTARWMLKFVAAYCLFDAIQLLVQAALKGAGDTRFVMLTISILSALFLLAGFWGAGRLTDDTPKLVWWWTMLTIWIVALSVAYSIRYRGGRWKSMRVIESDVVRPFGAH
jgi:MATE family multidrug resistance protein